ncbi:MAG: hypothetical protein BA863_09985 [Desulfovibrio sp. S3730MH75]|nr:MAG: hypothetical protein BA863_09985 [Desulfovibrio sp. S3730MH75]
MPRNLRVFIIISVFMLVLGCSKTSTNTQSVDLQPSGGSEITYGVAKKNIVIGKTRQEDVIKLFGSPDNMIMRQGRELWIYDRFRVESSSESSSGYGTLILFGGSSRKSTVSTQTKTLTVILDFNKVGIVEDFSMRVGGY